MSSHYELDGAGDELYQCFGDLSLYDLPTDHGKPEEVAPRMYTRSQAQIAASKAPPELSHTQPRHPCNLPPELLDCIFERTFLPNHLLDSSLSPGPTSQWCRNLRTIKNASLVSRMWYDCATRHLYRDVCIRRYHQLHRLFGTLAASEELGMHVRSIEIFCFVTDDDAKDLDVILGSVLKGCPNLTGFVYSSPCKSPIQSHTMSFQNSFPSHVTHLDIRPGLTIAHVDAMLPLLAPTLVSFTLYATDDRIVKTKQPNLEFPALHTLILHIMHHHSGDLFDVIPHWQLPNLRQLSIHNDYYVGPQGVSTRVGRTRLSFLSFLRQHGTTLKFLHISPFDIHEDWVKILEFCPHLEHLITDPYELLKDENFAHENLKWIDFRYLHCKSYSRIKDSNGVVNQYRRERIARLRYRLPALQGIRNLWALPTLLLDTFDKFPINRTGQHAEKRVRFDLYTGYLTAQHGEVTWDPIWLHDEEDAVDSYLEEEYYEEGEEEEEEVAEDYDDDSDSISWSDSYVYTSTEYEDSLEDECSEDEGDYDL